MTLKNKILSIVLSGFMVISFAACESGDIVEAGTPAGVDSKPAVILPEKPPVSNSSSIIESNDIEKEDKIKYPLKMYFSSGVGAWGSEILIHADGSFTGLYHDENANESGEEYPNGTIYSCGFSGKFTMPEQINEYTYSLKLERIEIDNENAEEVIIDGVLFKQAYPYGLMNSDDSDYATDFLLYTPNAPTLKLLEEEDFISWWPDRFGADINGTLNVYGLHNVETGDGFFSFLEN